MSIRSFSCRWPTILAAVAMLIACGWLIAYVHWPAWVHVDSPNDMFGTPRTRHRAGLYTSAAWVLLISCVSVVTVNRKLEWLAVVSGLMHGVVTVIWSVGSMVFGYDVIWRRGWQTVLASESSHAIPNAALALFPIVLFVLMRLRPNSVASRRVLAPVVGAVVGLCTAPIGILCLVIRNTLLGAHPFVIVNSADSVLFPVMLSMGMIASCLWLAGSRPTATRTQPDASPMPMGSMRQRTALVHD